MNREEVRKRIAEIGVIPAVRVGSADDAMFAAQAVSRGGIPIVEVTMTVPGAMRVIENLARGDPGLIAGAGTVSDIEEARRCLDAGAKFLTTPALDLEIVSFAARRDTVVFPGVLTPTEVAAAWRAGSDFVKVFPCAQVGGPSYIRALKAPFPAVPLIASGGVSQHTAGEFIRAGAVALGIGQNLIPQEAIEQRQSERIHELAHRFVEIVKEARSHRGEG
jgi:2-dehydro-3-deoxyphosphogluconate aldolase/(4S)-4-hydroxy-2-oxoglutarate aldolase